MSIPFDCIYVCSTLNNLKVTIYLKIIDFSHNHLTSSCISTILNLIQCSVIEELIVSNNSIDDSALTDAIFQLARFERNKICNLTSGVPLVIINAHTLQHGILLAEMEKNVSIFFMNCEIDKSVNNLITQHAAKKIFLMHNVITIILMISCNAAPFVA